MRIEELIAWVARQDAISAEMRDTLAAALGEVAHLREDMRDIVSTANRASNYAASAYLEDVSEIAHAALARTNAYEAYCSG